VTTELEIEILDALRFGASPLTGIAERVGGDLEVTLDVLLELERQALVRRHRPEMRLPAARSWWELTVEGNRRAG
jgi:hypothetical protein